MGNVNKIISEIETDTLPTNQNIREVPEILRSGLNEFGYKVIEDEEKDPNVVAPQATRDFFMLGDKKDSNGDESENLANPLESNLSQQISEPATSQETKGYVRKKLQSKDFEI